VNTRPVSAKSTETNGWSRGGTFKRSTLKYRSCSKEGQKNEVGLDRKKSNSSLGEEKNEMKLQKIEK
jgi:hypothetical protein